jgi:hypothetical protein
MSAFLEQIYSLSVADFPVAKVSKSVKADIPNHRGDEPCSPSRAKTPPIGPGWILEIQK